MAGPAFRVVRVTVLLWLIMVCCSVSLAANHVPQRRGKVIIIRGAFTVFSLGLNELGDKLANYGLDVDVIADISADEATSELIAQYRRNRNMGPIIFIGHSRGAELGPREAGELQSHKIPVKLIVMVDAVHPTTIPANVERCVNLYHDSAIGFVHGVPARAANKRTELRNVDIDRLRTREQGGSINHFNIDSSSWIHDLVIQEVLKVCPAAESGAASAVAMTKSPAKTRAGASAATRRSTASAPPAARVAQRQSASGLKYPAGVNADLWVESEPQPPVAPGRAPKRTPKQSTSSSAKSLSSSRAAAKKLTDTTKSQQKKLPVQTHLRD